MKGCGHFPKVPKLATDPFRKEKSSTWTEFKLNSSSEELGGFHVQLTLLMDLQMKEQGRKNKEKSCTCGSGPWESQQQHRGKVEQGLPWSSAAI